jgi:hypothetical protein
LAVPTFLCSCRFRILKFTLARHERSGVGRNLPFASKEWKPSRDPNSYANARPEKRLAMASGNQALRFEHYLDAVILFVSEDVIAVWRFVERHAVRNDEARVYLAPLDPFKQFAPVALDVALPCPHRQ